MHFSYKKLYHMCSTAYSDKNVILRQQYGLAALHHLSRGLELINIDESVLQTEPNSHKSWQPKCKKTFRYIRSHNYCMGMILAVSSTGRVLCTYVKGSNNQTTLMMFMNSMVGILDSEDANWRERTAFVLDNSTYHQGKGFKEYMEKLRVPLIFTGPYSFDGSPVERIFAFVKRHTRDELNYLKLGSGTVRGDLLLPPERYLVELVDAKVGMVTALMVKKAFARACEHMLRYIRLELIGKH
jgi:hypothetical protein